MRNLVFGLALVVAIGLATIPAVGHAAYAEVTAAAPSVSIPYVEDVNPAGGGYVATVTCSGSAKAEIRVTCRGKRVEARKLAPRTWAVRMRADREYRLSVRADGSAWKSIGYRIY